MIYKKFQDRSSQIDLKTVNFPDGPLSDDKDIGFRVVMGIDGDEYKTLHVSSEYLDVE